ncbi:restriction endonuclease subunit S [Agrobacterium sp. rho-13.3]|uniref:restriction endonuclease subunit S n=1 Tax=Agrobacterium sp. rho-13.3 TaxID=3072980 RepID=UPI002A172D77|nr:restriction endonuclease subunit S [Agrobacterium sp. rho-13.3]MDX8309034.1 restriction endonuclease subunit S [Agrobacterium sp. rho-13.3]
MSHEVPEGWRESDVAGTCEILDSRRKPLNSEERRIRRGAFPYWGANGIVDYIDDWLFDEPLVLMAEDGGYFDEASERPICHRLNGKAWVNNHAHVIRPTAITRDWFYYWFVHRDITPHIKGGTRSKLNQKDLKQLPILVPPLHEQRRIAEILSSVDEAIAATRAVIEQTRKVKQGVLERLLTKGIGHMRFKQTEIGEIPEGWEVVELQDVASVRTGIAKNKKEIIDAVDLPYLRVANVQDGYVDLSDLQNISIPRGQVERYSLQKGDVLMTEGGDYDKLGRGDVWDGSVEPCLHQNHVFAVRPDQSRIVPEFLANLTASQGGKAYFQSCSKRSTNLASINSTQVKHFPVKLPDLREQLEIVAVSKAFDAAISVATARLDRQLRFKSALMSDLLAGRKRVTDALLMAAE